MTALEKTEKFESALRAFIEAFAALDEIGASSLAMDVLAVFDEEMRPRDPLFTKEIIFTSRLPEAVEEFRKWAIRSELKESAEAKLTPAELAALYGRDFTP